MKNCSLVKNLSNDIWCRIRDGETLGIRQNEEGLTEHVLLILQRNNQSNRAVITNQTTRRREAKIGADWEWWIKRKEGWIRLAVQAKKLSIDGKYEGLDRKVRSSSKKQLSLLTEYAKRSKAIPAYSFFNYHKKANRSHLNCSCRSDLKCLGWTITCATRVAEACKLPPRNRTFDYFHKDHMAFPLKCLFCCHEKDNDYLKRYFNASSDYDIGFYVDLPDYVKDSIAEGRLTDDYLSGQGELHPRRVVVFGDEALR